LTAFDKLLATRVTLIYKGGMNRFILVQKLRIKALKVLTKEIEKIL